MEVCLYDKEKFCAFSLMLAWIVSPVGKNLMSFTHRLPMIDSNLGVGARNQGLANWIVSASRHSGCNYEAKHAARVHLQGCR